MSLHDGANKHSIEDADAFNLIIFALTIHEIINRIKYHYVRR